MAGKLLPRAKVRLRLDRGTALLRQLGASSLTVSILDISEGGCQCRVVFDDVDETTKEAWRQLLSPGRILSLEVAEPPELRGLQTAEAEVRWMRPNKHGHIDFGMALRDLGSDQLNILRTAMLSLASNKLRGRKPSEAEARLSAASRSGNTSTLESGQHTAAANTVTQTGRHPTSVTQTGRQSTAAPTRLVAFDEVPPPPPPPPPNARTSGMHPLRRTPAPGLAAAMGSLAESGAYKRGASGVRQAVQPPEPPPATPAEPNKRDVELNDLERQKRHFLQLPVNYQFCDHDKNLLDSNMYRGRTIDFNEGGFLLEGPSTDFCDPLQLPAKGVLMMITLESQPVPVAAVLEIRSVRQGNLAPGLYQFGVQIFEIRDEDRRLVREMYIRAGLTTLFRR